MLSKLFEKKLKNYIQVAKVIYERESLFDGSLRMGIIPENNIKIM